MSDLFTPAAPDQAPATLDALVGEGKKYKTVDDLAKAAVEKDRFIDQLQAETAAMRQEIGSKATLDEIMTKIREMTPSTPPSPQLPPGPDSEKLDQTKINELVSEMLNAREANQKTESNKAVVERTLIEKWGPDANLNLNKKALELGVTLDYLKKLSLESPKVFFNLVGLDKAQTQTPTAPAPRGSVTLPPAGSGERTKTFYDNIKKANPTEYFSPKIQNQMYKDAMRLGESFFDKD